MKKHLIILFSLIAITSFACSGFHRPFCSTLWSRPNDNVIYGTVTFVGGNHLKITVIEVLKGNENRSVITVWDGKDYDCNGNISMRVASMANTGDTLVMILPMILKVVNSWDVVGDYSRPDYLFSEPVVKVKNGVMKGMVNGNNHPSGPVWQLFDVRYSDFKSHMLQNSLDCTKLTDLQQQYLDERPHIKNNNGSLFLALPDEKIYYVRISSLDGKLMRTFTAQGKYVEDISEFGLGVYLVSINGESELYNHKIVKW